MYISGQPPLANVRTPLHLIEKNPMHDTSFALIERFNTLRVLVLGDVMLDVYDFCYSASSRPSPEKAGKRVYTAHRSVKSLGGAGNVAANLAALDISTFLIGVTGHDGHHFTMQKLADQASIEHCLIRDRTRLSTVKTRLYIDDEYLLRRDDETSASVNREAAATIVHEFRSELARADAVIISDYNKGFFTQGNSQAIIKACQEQSKPVIVDFKPQNRALFKGATLIAPNNLEASMMVDSFKRHERLEESVRELYSILESQNLVVTLGARGICGFNGRHFFHHAANAVREVDTVGCGDTVRAVLAAAFALGSNLSSAAALANDAAAVVLQKKGTATLSRQELIAFVEGKASCGGQNESTHNGASAAQ